MIAAAFATADDKEVAIRKTIQALNTAFDQGCPGPTDYATEDWKHINPGGGCDQGREATLKAVRAVHHTFLKGVADKIESVDMRFAVPDVEVATVTSVMGPYTTPDGVQHSAERHIRTFVVVQRNKR